MVFFMKFTPGGLIPYKLVPPCGQERGRLLHCTSAEHSKNSRAFSWVTAMAVVPLLCGEILQLEYLHIPDRKTVTHTSRCSESNSVFWCSSSDITAETNLNGLETTQSLMSHSNITHQVFLVLIAVPVCLREA